ncbi:MAG: sialate O-acetylesterase [Planctomycetaceae bacterium]|nr:sialate O-acetylesterase [Planctomycetaceae bacterium]
MNKTTTLLAGILLLLLTAASTAQADIKLPNVLGSHMVMQRDVPLAIWGTAAANEAITVTMGTDQASTTANATGNWRVQLKPQQADGKSRTLTVKGKNTVVLDDILIGEVWIGSGQSNMEWQLANTQDAKKAIAAANHPNLRLFHVPKVQAGKPATDVNAQWKACTPANVPAFSAVLYYFGRHLQQEIDLPIGLINSSWGGSPIEPWTITKGGSGGMYNGMIAPLTQFAVQGSIWYQGETNVLQKNGLTYVDKMKDLISGWRTAFNDPGHAFYFVQIAPWQGSYAAGQLPALWEAQVASLKIPGTGMAVTTDLVDNIRDIHPRNKLDVGERLAFWALTKTYGKKGIIYSGPLYQSLKVEGNKIRLSFAHTASGLKSRDGKPLSEFQVAGADGKFVAATATIDQHTVVVQAAEVAAPQQVRFGWHATTNPNLVNSAGLPASPFQTSNWQGGTGQ